MTAQVVDTKTCPYCAEVIKAAAIVCKHCGRDVGAGAASISGTDQALMAQLGITFADGRYIWRGNTFKRLEDAADHARQSTAQPAATRAAAKTHPLKTLLLTVTGLVAAFVLWALVRTPSPEEEAKHHARRAIELCWAEQSRKSLDPGTARFAASACEQMEARFRDTYRVAP